MGSSTMTVYRIKAFGCKAGPFHLQTKACFISRHNKHLLLLAEPKQEVKDVDVKCLRLPFRDQ